MTTYEHNKGKIYLSGGMQFNADLGAGWRTSCGNTILEMGYFPIDITSLDVGYTKTYGHLYRSFDDHDPTQALQKKSNIRRHFVHADLRLITDNSDAMIILYDESVRRGAGTLSECQIAFSSQIPIFLVNGYSDIKEVPGWLQSITTKMFPTFEQLYDYLRVLPTGVLQRDEYGNHHGSSHYLCFLCGEPFIKGKTHFVSKVSPLYCRSCVDIVKTTHESHRDRYDYFMEVLKRKEPQ